jgi:hypothetical protein
VSPEPAPRSVIRITSEGPADRLDSWKAIAAYFKRDLSTVQRWEKREGMPVHRHLHEKLGSAYAFRWELDAWSLSRKLLRKHGSGAEPPAGLSSLTDERRVSLCGSTVDDRSGDARTESDTATRAAISWRRAPQWPLLWLTIGAGVVLALGTAVWLLNGANYSWRNPLAEAQFRRVTDFGGTEQAAALSRDGEFIALLSDRGGLMLIELDPYTTEAFRNTTPNTRRATFVMVNIAFNGLGLAVDASGGNETSPPAAELSLPLHGATGVTTATPFNWTAVPGAVHRVVASGVARYTFAFPGPSHAFLTSGTSATLPDVTSDAPFLPASTAYTWGVYRVVPYAGVEAASAGIASEHYGYLNLIGETLLNTRPEGFVTISASRSFATGR